MTRNEGAWIRAAIFTAQRSGWSPGAATLALSVGIVSLLPFYERLVVPYVVATFFVMSLSLAYIACKPFRSETPPSSSGTLR